MSQLRFYDPGHVQVRTGSSHGDVAQERLKKIQASVAASFHRYEHYLFPVISWKNDPAEHWALLVLEASMNKIRY